MTGIIFLFVTPAIHPDIQNVDIAATPSFSEGFQPDNLYKGVVGGPC